jgi:phospholipid N-methyltransferase
MSRKAFPEPAGSAFQKGAAKAESLSQWYLYWRFIVAALTRQGQIGAIVPSQRFLVRQMISPISAEYRGRIVELGAGNGALTVQLAAKCRKAKVLACEINPGLARDVRSRLVTAGLDQRVQVVTEPAEQVLSRIEAGPSQARPDFVVSGIPLGNMMKGRAEALIECIHRALGPGGMYIQFQYSLLDRKKVKTRFAMMRTVPVLFNFPPAVVYYARK